jgi:O-antigen/teichoic acid export membrane protein
LFFSFTDLLRILSSTALSNGFLVVLSLILARTQTTAAYGDFAYSVAIFAVASLFLDFGLNISALKRHSSDKTGNAATTFASIKLCAALLILVCACIAMFVSPNSKTILAVSIGLCCAAFNNVWIALRVADQSSGNARNFYRANLGLFGLRLVAVCVTYVSGREAIEYLLALYVYPYFILFIRHYYLLDFKKHISLFVQDLRGIFAYSKWIFLSAVLFVVSLQLPVLSLKYHGLTQQLATLGLAMTIASFSSWLSYSLKPFFIGRYLASDNISNMAYIKMLVVFSAALIPCTILVYYLFLVGFSEKYPGVEFIGCTVFIYSSLVFILGLYNSQIHVVERPELETLVNLGRAICVFLVMYFFPGNLVTSMLLVGVVMVGFELVLISINFRLVGIKNENSLS